MSKEFEPTGWLPDYTTLRGLLTPEECQAAIRACDEHARPSTRIGADGSLVLDTKFRRCQHARFIPGDPVYAMIASKILARIAEFDEHYQFEFFPEPERMIPLINLNRYDGDGGFINQHTDLAGYKGTENCKLSVSILLNDEFEGGELYVYGGLYEYPLNDAKAGDACAFPSFMVHAVTPVTKGTRYTAVAWLRGPRFR